MLKFSYFSRVALELKLYCWCVCPVAASTAAVTACPRQQDIWICWCSNWHGMCAVCCYDLYRNNISSSCHVLLVWETEFENLLIGFCVVRSTPDIIVKVSCHTNICREFPRDSWKIHELRETTACLVLQFQIGLHCFTVCLSYWCEFHTRGSAIAWCSVSVHILYYSCTNNVYRSPVSAWGSLSAIATFCLATCIVSYMHRHSRLNYRTAWMRWCAYHQQTFIQPTLLMSTGP